MMDSQHQPPPPSTAHVDVFRLSDKNEQQEGPQQEFMYEYPPRIPVAMRHPYPRVNSVKQYTRDRQLEQLQHHIVSESFIPVSPETAEKPQRRSRRRPPFSYSSLIAQAILTTSNKRMTLRDIYQWIMEKYPALYNAEDTGWQNTIRHNLSLNKCFKKVPKSEITPDENRGKGGFWTLDPEYMSQYTDGAFARGSIANRRSIKNVSQPTNKSRPSSDNESSSNTHHQMDLPHHGFDNRFHQTESDIASHQRNDDRYYPTEESDISSPSSPSLLRMSPVTPPRSSVTIKVSPHADRGSHSAVNIVNNTPIEQTVANLDIHSSRLKESEYAQEFLSSVIQETTVPDNPLHASTVMRIDNLLN